MAQAKQGEAGAESSQSFSIVGGPAQSDSSSGFVIVGDKSSKVGGDQSSQNFGIESCSSIQGKEEESKSQAADSELSKNFVKNKGTTGKTREEVFLGLKIKKAQLLPSGEVQLGNGKIIGTRKWRYIYKQKPRPIDDREAVVINKIALEYRKLRALQNGGVGDSLAQQDFQVARKERTRQQKIESKQAARIGMQANRLQHYFTDPTAHL